MEGFSLKGKNKFRIVGLKMLYYAGYLKLPRRHQGGLLSGVDQLMLRIPGKNACELHSFHIGETQLTMLARKKPEWFPAGVQRLAQGWGL